MIASLVALALVGSACADSTSDASTSSSQPVQPSSTTTVAPTTTSTTIVAVDPDCPTAYYGVAHLPIEEGDASACVRVGTHFDLIIFNGLSDPLEIMWDGEPVIINGNFQTGRDIGRVLPVGVHRIQSPQLPITIEVVDPATSPYAAEPMYLRSWGNLRPGQTIAEAETAGVSIFIPENEAGIIESEFCDYGFVEGDPYSPGIMILNQTDIARLEATWPGHRTASGIAFGSTTDQVLATYEGQIERSPHEYRAGGGGEYLTFIPVDAADRPYALVFETDDEGIVSTFRTGLAGPVRWVEGCL